MLDPEQITDRRTHGHLPNAGLVTGLATPAFASSAPGTSVSFTVSPPRILSQAARESP